MGAATTRKGCFAVPQLTPEQRVLRARYAAQTRWSNEDPVEGTRKAREAFAATFEREVDPDGVLPLHERQRRAEARRAAHFTKLALQSSIARARGNGSAS